MFAGQNSTAAAGTVPTGRAQPRPVNNTDGSQRIAKYFHFIRYSRRPRVDRVEGRQFHGPVLPECTRSIQVPRVYGRQKTILAELHPPDPPEYDLRFLFPPARKWGLMSPFRHVMHPAILLRGVELFLSLVQTCRSRSYHPVCS